MKALIFLIALMTVVPAQSQTEKPVVIAVIDTGFGFKTMNQSPTFMCKYGHKDFTNVQKFLSNYGTVDPIPVDNHGHGTNIAGLIGHYGIKAHKDFCVVVLKYYDPTSPGENNLVNIVKAIKYATDIHADVINMSGGGTEFSRQEHDAVVKFLDQGGTFVAAAGNDGRMLSHDEGPRMGTYYPAMYDKRIVVVGNLTINGKVNSTSNFGPFISRWEIGTNQEGFGLVMTGTSQATAVATGKILSEKIFTHDRK